MSMRDFPFVHSIYHALDTADRVCQLVRQVRYDLGRNNFHEL